MDDWVLLTQKHGRIYKGFDFLGYRFGDTPRGEIKIAKGTWQNHFDKLTQRVRHKVNEVDLLDYIKRWWSWVRLKID
jgi:hypothetical protein